jgi:peptidoglycan/LPS O-acetylase OafA/YrhL
LKKCRTTIKFLRPNYVIPFTSKKGGQPRVPGVWFSWLNSCFISTMAQLLTSIKTEARPPTTAISRLPSLDGWRAVSILLVLGCHSTYAGGFPAALTPAFNAIFDGNLGVRFFFIISGFLITWLMILENEKNGSVSLREFYIRRCLRILPIYLVFLGVLAVLELAGIGRESTAAWVGNLTFTRNFLGGFLGGDSFSAHLWSLSVEEQFYLIWPILYLLLRKQGERSLLGILAIPILAAPAIRGIGIKWFYPGVFYSQMLKPVFWGDSFFKYFDTLAFGCACAVLLTHRRVMIERGLKNRPGVTVATGIALILFPHYSSWLHLEAVAVAQAGQTLQALGFSILLLHSVLMPEWFGYRALNWEWVRRIGIWSYSLYIWQQLFWRAPQCFGLNRVWWMGVWMIPLFAVTMASYYGLERSLFKLRSRYREVKIGTLPSKL